ncbi:MAG: CrcB family protein [Deltaproteobacteria bacterium]|jgi:fluoride exporter|nr:CrcB family protein [Deltaproteobacteria bacterium]
MIRHHILFTGMGGALGAIVRGYLGVLINTNFPWAILIVNVVGSFLVGVFVAIFAGYESSFSQHIEIISLGFCGGFTTFSSFSYQSVDLFRSGKRFHALINIFLSLILSIGAAWLGMTIAEYFT